MDLKRKRWFPKPGDLVAVPYDDIFFARADGSCSYGIVVKETDSSDFTGVWWDVFFEGGVKSLNIQIITPLWDSEGVCLRS